MDHLDSVKSSFCILYSVVFDDLEGFSVSRTITASASRYDGRQDWITQFNVNGSR